MAKKKASSPDPSSPASPSPARPRRAPARRAAPAPRQGGAGSGPTTEPTDTAADYAQAGAFATSPPSYEEIAEAAYHRFLQRGGGDGRDFDDWIEAEQELRRARTPRDR